MQPEGHVNRDALAIAAELGVELWVRFDADTTPTEFLFQDEGIADGYAVKRTKVQEESTLLVFETFGDPSILPDVRSKVESACGKLKLIFYSSSPIFDVSPFAMGRDSLPSENPGATSQPIYPLIL